MGTGKSPRSTVGKLETQEIWWHGSRPNVGRLETQEVPVLQTQGNQTGGVFSYQPFSSVQAPSWLEEAHPYREGSLLYHVCWFKCEFAPEAPSHTLRIVFDPISTSYGSVKLMHRMNPHKYHGKEPALDFFMYGGEPVKGFKSWWTMSKFVP